MNTSVLILDSNPTSRQKLNQAIHAIETLDSADAIGFSIHNNDNFQDAINSINNFKIDIIIINISSIAVEEHIEECIQLKNIYSFAPIIAISETASDRLDGYNYIGLDDILNIDIISAPILSRVISSSIQRYKNFNAFHSLNQKKLVSNQLLKLLLEKKSLMALAEDACRIIHSQSLKSDTSSASIYLFKDDKIERIAHVGIEESEETISKCKEKLLRLKNSESKSNDFEYFKIDSKLSTGKIRVSVPLKKDNEIFAFLKIKTNFSIVHPSEEFLYYQDISTSLADVFILAQERERFEQINQQNIRLIDDMSSAVIGVDISDCITHWNNQSEKYFGLSNSKTIGEPTSSLDMDLDWSVITYNLNLFLSHNIKLERFDVSYKRKDDNQNRILSASITPFIESNGSFSGYLLLMDDITEKRHLEERHQQSMYLESIGQLAAGIAHEINTPMQYISDNLNFLRESYNDTNKALKEIKSAVKNNTMNETTLFSILNKADIEYLSEELPIAFKQTTDGVDRVCTIVKAMKEYSHPSSVNKTPTNINDCIESTVIISKHTWKYYADLTKELDPNLKPVMCYAGPFNEVILNIIVNAADAIKYRMEKDDSIKRGKIKIQTFGREDFVEIRISDNGGGIPDSIQEKIFDPFFTTKEVGKGTGQGLSLSYRIIKDRHEGEMFFESVQGEGTTFVIKLPYQ